MPFRLLVLLAFGRECKHDATEPLLYREPPLELVFGSATTPAAIPVPPLPYNCQHLPLRFPVAFVQVDVQMLMKMDASQCRRNPVINSLSNAEFSTEKDSRSIVASPCYLRRCERQDLNLHGFPHWILRVVKADLATLSLTSTSVVNLLSPLCLRSGDVLYRVASVL